MDHPNKYNGTFPFLNIALWYGVSYQRVHELMTMALGDIPDKHDGNIKIATLHAEGREASRRKRE